MLNSQFPIPNSHPKTGEHPVWPRIMSSVIDLQSELDLPRILRGVDHRRAGVQRTRGGADIQGAAGGWIEVRVVKDVEDLAAELHLTGFSEAANLEVLDKGHIEVVHSRSFDGVSAGITKRVQVGHGEHARIEPLARIALSARFVRIADRIGTLTCG